MHAYGNAQKEFIQNLKRRGLSKATIRGYSRDLNLFNNFLSKRYNSIAYIDEITIDDIEDYIDYLADERELKPSSRNRYVSSISSFLTYALKKDWIAKNPAALVESSKVVEQPKISLNETEVNQLLNAIEKPLLQMAVLFMAKTGLRINELTNLSMSAVDLETNVIHIYDAKGGKYRKVPISTSLRSSILNYLETIRESNSEYFFATKKTGRISAQYMNQELRRASEKLEWKKKITNHTMRRSFATNLLRKGADVVTIQNLLGHESLKTTSLYLNLQSIDLRNAVNLLD